MRIRATVLLLALVLSGCAEYADNTRAAIRSWCEETPRYCNVNAVK